ncbi:MAG: NmrA/HSCARG family protein [Rhodothermales bacterium]|nr:NmrA/HSCARG family protein [Rhodothermales bacterium]
MPSSSHVLVTGVTGQQGGSVANALLARGHRVRGLTRNTGAPTAAHFAARGAELMAGDFTDSGSLDRAMAGIDAIYAMTTPFEAGEDAETAQGIALIEAAKRAGVKHFVYSSVASADLKTGIPHFDSKFRVEEVLAASGVPYTISAPVFFMENLLAPWLLPGIMGGTLAMAMPGDRPLQQIAVADIGAFAAVLIERGERVFGKRFNIAGDELTNSDVAAILSRKLGRPIVYQGFPPDALRAQSEDMAIMFEWFATTGYSADLNALRREFGDVSWQDFKTWASHLDLDQTA